MSRGKRFKEIERKKRKVRKKKSVERNQMILGFLLIIAGIIVFLIPNFKKNIEAKEEANAIDKFFQHEVEYSENNEVVEDEFNEDEYSSVLEIPKINLKKGLYSKDSKFNDIKYNIQIMQEADMPDVDKGNFILASHNGNSSISFFDNLRKLSGGDDVFVYYQGIKYKYKLVNIYEVKKSPNIELRNNETKTSITMITCKNGDKRKQVVYIGELVGEERY